MSSTNAGTSSSNNTVSKRIKHSVFKSSSSSKSNKNADMPLVSLSKTSHVDASDNGGFLAGASLPVSSTVCDSSKQTSKPNSNASYTNTSGHTANSLKSSVKRLFSPISNKNASANANHNNHNTNSLIASLPSGVDSNAVQPSSTPILSAKKHQNSMRQAPSSMTSSLISNQSTQNYNAQAQHLLDQNLNAKLAQIKSLEKPLHEAPLNSKQDQLSASTCSATSTLSTSTSGANNTNSSLSSAPSKPNVSQPENNKKLTLTKKDKSEVVSLQ